MYYFLGYKFCVKRKCIKWILIVFFAMLFHKSSFIVFPMYFFAKITFSRFFVNVTLVSCLILKKIDLLNVLCSVLAFVPGHYAEYAETLKWLSTSSGSGIIGYLYLVIIFIINNFKFRDIFFSNVKLKTYTNIFLFGTFFINVFSNIYMVIRLMEYFVIAIVIIFPFYFTFSKKNKYLYIFSLFIISCYLLNILKYAFFSAPESLLAYQTVFSK
ncbi:MAG: EpsG family protein [Treponema sp.]|nr:EpsG family protein [Treponema sp.]